MFLIYARSGTQTGVLLVPVHFHTGLETVRLAVGPDGRSVIHEAFLALYIQEGQIAGVEYEQDKAGLDTASGRAIFLLDGQGVDKLALKGAAVFGVKLHGGFEAAFLVQAFQFLRADAKSDGMVFNTYIHGLSFSFNSVTVTCAL